MTATYTSSDPDVAVAVDAAGRVTALKAGTATITAQVTSADKTVQTYTYQVIVTQ